MRLGSWRPLFKSRELWAGGQPTGLDLLRGEGSGAMAELEVSQRDQKLGEWCRRGCRGMGGRPRTRHICVGPLLVWEGSGYQAAH